jgi:hypothetical protein
MMIESTDFKFRDDLTKTKEGDTVAIEILLSPYNGVIIRYTQVGIKEQDNGTAVLRFAYDLLETGTHSELSLRRDKKFETHLGILLNHLILEAAEIPDNANREDYSEEPDEERTVHAEGSPIHQG